VRKDHFAAAMKSYKYYPTEYFFGEPDSSWPAEAIDARWKRPPLRIAEEGGSVIPSVRGQGLPNRMG
jgi:hypothetical protein